MKNTSRYIAVRRESIKAMYFIMDQKMRNTECRRDDWLAGRCRWFMQRDVAVGLKGIERCEIPEERTASKLGDKSETSNSSNEADGRDGEELCESRDAVLCDAEGHDRSKRGASA